MSIAQIYFYLLAIVAVLGALATVSAKNPIRGAMGLLTTVVSIAGLFLALHAEFLAAIQLIVYAGAIVVLFLFVIMLLGPSATPPRDSRGSITRTIGGTALGVALVGLGYLVARDREVGLLRPVDADFGGVDSIGRILFSDAVVPFELSSALLMVAIVGAVAVARGRHKSDPEHSGASAEGTSP